jgi:hypothetical protein
MSQGFPFYGVGCSIDTLLADSCGWPRKRKKRARIVPVKRGTRVQVSITRPKGSRDKAISKGMKVYVSEDGHMEARHRALKGGRQVGVIVDPGNSKIPPLVEVLA